MRRRIAGQDAGMHCDTRPGDALHKGHRRAAVDVGVMHFVLLDDAEHPHRGCMTLHARGHRTFREESVGVVDPDILLIDRDRDDQRSLGPGAGFLFHHRALAGRRFAHARLPRLNRRHRPVITGIGIRPVKQRGVGMRRGADGAGGCQNRHSPPSLAENVCASAVQTKNPLPAHAQFLSPDRRIRIPVIISLSQTRKAFTSASPRMPMVFAAIVAKKPHIPLNAGEFRHTFGLSVRLSSTT